MIFKLPLAQRLSYAAEAAADVSVRKLLSRAGLWTDSRAGLEAMFEHVAEETPTARHPREISKPAQDAKPVATEAVKPRAPSSKRQFVVLAFITLVLVTKPYLLPTIMFAAFLIILISYLTLGPDRVADIVAGAWRWLARRRPALAERLRARSIEAAIRIDNVLAWLPGNLDDKISLHDALVPVELEQSLQERPDPFEKLERDDWRSRR